MGALRRFLASFGWRILAVPVLIVATVLVLAPADSTSRLGAVDRTANERSGLATGPGTTRQAQERPEPLRPRPARTSPAPSRSPRPRVEVCAGNTELQLILVSIGKQRAWMCERGRQVKTSAVTTGKLADDSSTPTGTWEITGKETDRYLNGPGYSDFVEYWLPFYGDFGFHDATWQTMSFGSPGYRTQGSHGCIHLPTPMMAWLYQWVQIGATATVVD
jgi:lipoprotein-anchoring transpeptidase ErfK/SrfK